MRTFYMICSVLIIVMRGLNGYAATPVDEFEAARMRLFLVQQSAVPGVMNYEQIGLTSMTDVSWREVPGLYWNNTTYHLERVEWSGFNLSGSLDVSDFTGLRNLYVHFNDLKLVNVRNCTSLINLDLYENDLSEIDVSTNPALLYMRLGYNHIRFVDISNNPNLMFLCCTENQVETLDISNHEWLETVYCIGNGMQTLLVDNCTNLEILLCSQNELKSLNMYNLPSLIKFTCFYNSLNELRFFNCTSLVDIDCSFNEITTLDVSTCEKLTTLDCTNNQLESINIAGCNRLTKLTCRNNQLTSLDISKTPSLSTLFCTFNKLSLLTLPPDKPPLTTYSYSPQQNITMKSKYDQVDFSEFYKIEGQTTSFIWRNRYTVVRPLESHEGRFAFSESYIGDSLTCLMQNNFFPLLWMQYVVKFTENDDSGNDNPAIGQPVVYAGEAAIHITTVTPAVVSIYSLQGALQLKKTVSAGYSRFVVERGIYVVVVNDTSSYKVIVR